MPGPAPFSEYEVPAPPRDPISALAFYRDASSPRAQQLLVASWDKFVRLYDLSRCAADAADAPVLQSFEHPAAVLDVCWISESLAASACLDRRVRLLLSGSWDATLKLWDPVTPDAYLRHTIPLPGKVFAMDTVSTQSTPASPRLVVAMPDRAVYVYSLLALRRAVDADATDEAAYAPEQKRESSLKFMLRDVRCMPDGVGYATSSVEGRVAVEFFDPGAEAQAQKYAFKCHRKEVDGVDVVYPIHAMAFHPIYGTFATAGGDAHCALWDPVAKKRIRQYALPSPLSAAAFSADGALFAVASGGENMDGAGAESAPGASAPGSLGHVKIHVKPATEEAKPKVKGAK
ncbi:mitotic spindle checkpoint protein Bub3 [Malassezia sp. CBS 17886]|nr:mitotic spindle checkpoint protein Bub3 [Malassezia sp. CBS 17886]